MPAFGDKLSAADIDDVTAFLRSRSTDWSARRTLSKPPALGDYVINKDGDAPLFGELAVVDTPSGIMAVALLPGCSARLKPDTDTLVLDGVQDPGNLGSILRSAAAAGFRQVALSPDCAQVWSPSRPTSRSIASSSPWSTYPVSRARG